MLGTQGDVALITTAAGGLIQQGASGTVTAPDGHTISLVADSLTPGANMSAGVVEFTRFSAGNIIIGGGALTGTFLDPADLATFLGAGHLRLIATDTIAVQAALTRATGLLTLRTTSPSGGGLAVNASLDVGLNTAIFETPSAIAGAEVITADNLVARGGPAPDSRAASLVLTGANRAAGLDARTDGGPITFTNTTNLRVTQANARGTSAGAVGITVEGAGLLLDVTGTIEASGVTLVADDMSISPGAPALIVPGGAVRLMPFTAGRGVTLGGEVAGTLSLSTAELETIGGLGLDGRTNPATILRIGRLAATPVGDITVAGDVSLRDRVNALELFATGSITGSGVVNVPDFGAVAGSDITLDGGNLVDRLAPITDAGTINGESLVNTAIWGGARNTDPAGLAPAREPDSVLFRNAAALEVAGSVLSSGSGTLTLDVTGGLVVNANRWVAAEAGALIVLVGGELTNMGTMLAAPIVHDDVLDSSKGQTGSSVMAVTGSNSGTIALGLNEGGATLISGIGTNSGLLLADIVRAPAITNETTGRIRAALIETTTGDIANDGVLRGDAISARATITNTGTMNGLTIHAIVDIGNSGTMLAGGISAGNDITNTGTMLAATVEAGRHLAQDAGEMGAGGGRVPFTFDLTSTLARNNALAGEMHPQAEVDAPTTGYGALGTIRAVTGNITQTGGEWVAAPQSGPLPLGGTLQFIADAGSITQTGGAITAPGIAARAVGSITLDQEANTFARIAVSTGDLAAFPLDGAPLMTGFGVGSGTEEVRLTTRATALGASTLIVEADGGIRAATDAQVRVLGTDGGLEVNAPIRVGDGRTLTLIADDMALNAAAGSMTLVAPAGTVRLRSETPLRGVALGTAVAGNLSLTTDELARIGGTGADGATNAAARLRIGDNEPASAAGSITITGDVLLRPATAPTDAASLIADIPGRRVGVLELVSGPGAITQEVGTRVQVGGITARAVGSVLLHDGAAHGAASGNAIDRIVNGTDNAGTPLGTPIGIRGEIGAVALSTWRSLTVDAPVTAGTDAILRVAPGTNPGQAGLLTINAGITVGNGRALTLIADDMAVNASLVVPAGELRIMPFSAGRNVTLGADGPGTLALNPTELAFIGATDDALTIMRVGRAATFDDAIPGNAFSLAANRVGNISVGGEVALRPRVGELELFASGSITGVGALHVQDFGAVAGSDLILTGASTVGRLRPITDIGIWEGFLLGQPPMQASIWGGTRNSDPATRQPDRVEFQNATALVIEGGVVGSGSGGVTVNAAGNLTVAEPDVGELVWIASEAGPVTVTATGVLRNEGIILSGDLSGGTVSGGEGLINEAIIALGRDTAGTIGTPGATLGNTGLLMAGTVQGSTITNTGEDPPPPREPGWRRRNDPRRHAERWHHHQHWPNSGG